MKSIEKRVIFIFVAFILIIIIGFPILEKSDNDQLKMKIFMFNKLKEVNHFKSSDTQITNYVDSACTYLFKKYKNLKKIPSFSNLDSTDKDVLIKYTINNLISDSIEKKFYLSHFEEIKRKDLFNYKLKDSVR